MSSRRLQIPGTVSISKFLRTCFLFSLFTTTQLYLIFVSTPSRLSCDCTGSVLQKVVFVNKIPKSNILSSSEVGVAETQWSILTCLSLCVTVYIVYVHVRRKQIDENRKENETFNTSDACQFSLTVFTCFEIKTHYSVCATCGSACSADVLKMITGYIFNTITCLQMSTVLRLCWSIVYIANPLVVGFLLSVISIKMKFNIILISCTAVVIL